MGPLPLWSLLPEVVQVAGSRPVLAAGGIVDGQGLAAALCFGAAGVLMGTRFLATPECPAWDAHKQAIVNSQLGDTVAAGIFDILGGSVWPGGIKARTLKNQMTARWADREAELLAEVETERAALRQAETVQNTAIMLLLAGVGSGRIREVKPAGQIVRDVVSEAEQILRRLNSQINL
jgi:nitronate monooxygenase